MPMVMVECSTREGAQGRKKPAEVEKEAKKGKNECKDRERGRKPT